MNDETRKIFVAPWRATDLDYVEDANGFFVCECGTHLAASNIASLPELYDALKGAVQEACGTCAMMHVNPDSYDFVENGCPFSEENNTCDYREYIAILRKVRDGE